jgi:beta-galactosidase
MVATLLDRGLLAQVVADAAGPPRTPSVLAGRPSTVTAHSLTGPRGRVWVVHNWSPEPCTVELARGVASVLDGSAGLAGGAEVALGPWDVRVWREA